MHIIRGDRAHLSAALIDLTRTCPAAEGHDVVRVRTSFTIPFEWCMINVASGMDVLAFLEPALRTWLHGSNPLKILIRLMKKSNVDTIGHPIRRESKHRCSRGYAKLFPAPENKHRGGAMGVVDMETPMKDQVWREYS